MTTSCPCCGQPVAKPLSDLIPLTEVQSRLELGRDKVRRLIRAGTLPGLYDGHTYTVPRIAFERWLAGEIASTPMPEPIPFPTGAIRAEAV